MKIHKRIFYVKQYLSKPDTDIYENMKLIAT